MIQPTRWTTGALRAALETAGVEHRSGPLGFGFTVKTPRIRELPGYAEGGFIVQDSAQRRLVDYIGVRENARVWDACASPGGKTATLARTCTVIASDASRSRIGRLRENLNRSAPQTPIVVADARHPPFRRHSFDITVIDAPCTATGTLARHPDARWRLSADRLKKLTSLQQKILDGAAESTPRNGLLVYLTCSVEPEENEHQIEGFLRRNPGFQRDNPDLFLLPGTDRADGGFGARLRRVT